jgi:hypothetical protein
MSLKLGGLHEKHAVATWNLGTIKAEEKREREKKGKVGWVVIDTTFNTGGGGEES